MFVVLLAGLAWVRPLARRRKLIASALALIAVGVIVLEGYSSRWLGPPAASVLRDWLPVLLLLFPYWQVGQLFTGADPLAEKRLGKFDQMFFRAFGVAPAETSVGPATGMFLELAYVMVYPLIPLGLAILYATHSRQFVNYYWIVVLLATYVFTVFAP